MVGETTPDYPAVPADDHVQGSGSGGRDGVGGGARDGDETVQDVGPDRVENTGEAGDQTAILVADMAYGRAGPEDMMLVGVVSVTERASVLSEIDNVTLH
jgi:hypothetical protein